MGRIYHFDYPNTHLMIGNLATLGQHTRLVSLIRYFPFLIGACMALLFSTGAEDFWDSPAALYLASGHAILVAPIVAAVTAFDIKRLTHPTWARNFANHKNATPFLLLISLAEALAGAAALAVSMVVSTLVASNLGSTPHWEPRTLLNGFPLLATGAGFGLLAGRFLPKILAPMAAGLAMYGLILLQPTAGPVELFTAQLDQAPYSTLTVNENHLTVRALAALGVAVVLLALGCKGLASRLRVAAGALVGAVVVAAGVGWAHSGEVGDQLVADRASVEVVCVGAQPRVCLPRGTEGYGPAVQQQLADQYHLFDELGVVGPEEYRMSWAGIEDVAGSVGSLVGSPPKSWTGEYQPSVVADILGSPTVRQECFGDTEQAAARRTQLRQWFAARIADDAAASDAPVSTKVARREYLALQGCQLG